MDSYDKILYLSYVKDTFLENSKIYKYETRNWNNNIQFLTYYYKPEINKEYHRQDVHILNIEDISSDNNYIKYKRAFDINELLDDCTQYDDALIYIENIIKKNLKKMITKEDFIERERQTIKVGSHVYYNNFGGIVTYKHQGSKKGDTFTILCNNTYYKYVPLSKLVKRNVKTYTNEELNTIPDSFKKHSTKKLLKLREEYYHTKQEIPITLRMELSTREHVATKNDKKSKKTVCNK